MKKSELKNMIKECVKEVIFEKGVLSGIITEVIQGTQSLSPLVENQKRPEKTSLSSQTANAKKKVLSAIGQSGYEEAKKKFKNPALFEGTRPIPEGSGKGALAGVAPDDAGVDITNIPGMGNWAAVAAARRK